MNLFFKMNTQNTADDIIKNILQTGSVPNNTPYTNGNKVTMKLTSLINVIETIKNLEQEYHEKQHTIASLKNRIEELEMQNMENMDNMVCTCH